ncbi:MAG: bifunctional ADP-dependent NAD(P)H-hydrate dehydratase/NAD(P)H-hydrate epimerase [Epsilonproteobacteria bacterium]|nr:MAG: bifunctional ADP-dependent NAD(P)H-hydrate dehydratase/NAD(P)H-hydrate epimerase [Campylobacterota bacterium]
MQFLFNEVTSLDRRCYEQFDLSEDILMEHAADGMADYIRQHFSKIETIVIVCGAGNNGADGITLARLLYGEYAVKVYLPFGVKSPMAQLQFRRAEKLGLLFEDDLSKADILVDALFGSGFSQGFNDQSVLLLKEMNEMDAVKIACDIPSGLHLDGRREPQTFQAEITLTMGALKRGMFSDTAKEVVGNIAVLDLGISREQYETTSLWQLLERADMQLPHRLNVNSHKGSYGHLGVICGEKEGAAVIAGSAALHFGSGLVTLLSNEKVNIPYELMQSHLLPSTTTAMALGMGLGQEFSESELLCLLDHNLPLLLDADIFSHPLLSVLLERQNSVLTPHPKEFISLLKQCDLADITVEELQLQRFHYVELFSKTYPHITLLLKGANVIIAFEGKFFVNPHGTNVLAKGGSGDVLSGLIGALLAQGYTPLDAAISGSLAHTAIASAWDKNSYAFTPNNLIEGLASL